MRALNSPRIVEPFAVKVDRKRKTWNGGTKGRIDTGGLGGAPSYHDKIRMRPSVFACSYKLKEFSPHLKFRKLK